MDFITDRTESDALLGNSKGVYGYEDLNRAESAVQSLIDEGFAQHLQTKTDWGIVDEFSIQKWPVSSQMNRYLENVKYIQKIFAISIKLPDSMNRLDWNGANNIEKVLRTALGRVAGVKENYRYSGEMYAGEEIL